MDMEKKSIGRFISVLRRANGMTQQELGDRLFVSDKTVSRWERDESTPDLSLIPEIADIFGVTVDELLRGERRSIEQAGAANTDSAPQKAGRSARRFKALLRKKKTKFRNSCLISLGLTLLGMLLTWILSQLRVNQVHNEETVAFLVGLSCIAVSVTVLLCTVNATLSMDDHLDSEEDNEELSFNEQQTEWLKKFRSKIIQYTVSVLIVDVIATISMIPEYVIAVPMISRVFLLIIMGLLLFVPYDLIAERILLKKGCLYCPESVLTNKLEGKRKRTWVTVIGLAWTMLCVIGLLVLDHLWITLFMEGRSFPQDDLEGLQAYVDEVGVERDMEGDQIGSRSASVTVYNSKGELRTLFYDRAYIFAINTDSVNGETVHTVYLTEEYMNARSIVGILGIVIRSILTVGWAVCIVSYVVLLVKYRVREAR